MRTALLAPFFATMLAPILGFGQAAPEAHVRAVQAEVEVANPSRHSASTGETLQRGQRITTRANASADLSVGAASVHLSDNTSLILFAPATPVPSGQTASDDSTLVRGQVSITVPPQAPHTASVSIATRAAVISFGAGDEAVIGSDASGGTRLAVQHGSVRVRAGGREVSVRAGLGVRVDPRRPPGAPRPLPPSPIWSQPPPVAMLSHGTSVDASGAFEPAGHGAPQPLLWHVQLARDEAFTDRLIDQTQAGRMQRFDAPHLGPGRYFARVAAIDADRFESTFSPVAPIVVAAPHIVPGGQGRRAHVEIPPGFFCGLDGGPLAPSTGSLWLLAARQHTVRCATNAAGANAVELPIAASDAGPIEHSIRIEPDDFDPLGGTRTIVLRLADGGGMPIAYASIRATVNEGAEIESFREADERGVYTATLHWRRGLNGLRIHFTVNDGIEFDEQRGVTADAAASAQP